VTWAAVSARRLQRHGLASPLDDGTPATVAARMCGTHAQVMSAAELSIGLRLATGSRADVRAALWDERSLVKTFGPRGTVHLLPAAQLPMWTGALSALRMLPYSFPADIRLSPDQTDAVVAAVAAAVDGAELTIDELSDAVIDLAGPWAGDRVMPAFQDRWPRWRQAVTTAGHRGAVCFGPNRGRNVTYTSPSRWLPGFAPDDGSSALGELLRSYLRSYGPATPVQFARWLNAPGQWATQLFESLGDELECVSLAGTLAWVCAGDAVVPPAEPEGVRLLPYFDAYVVGGQPRELLYPGRAAERALTGGQAGNVPVLLIDGTVAGVWHQRRSGRKIAVTVEPFGRLSAARRRALEAQVERVGQILEAEPTLTIGTVTVGPHA
jgi:uncharacterized protein YukE